jgi:hypothetical protein
MTDHKKLQFTEPELPTDELGKLKAHILDALMHVEREDPDAVGAVDMLSTALGTRNLVSKMVNVELSFKFTVQTEIYPHVTGTEEEFLDDLMAKLFPSAEVLNKDVATLVAAQEVHTNGDGTGSEFAFSMKSDVGLEIDRVYDAEEREKPLPPSSPTESIYAHQPVEMSFRSSGLPVILDADSDRFNRVVGMEFHLAGHHFKAAFANSHGTVLHLYEKVGRKWRPLCDRRNALSPNGISIQTNRDHRKWCEQCENKYANKVTD